MGTILIVIKGNNINSNKGEQYLFKKNTQKLGGGDRNNCKTGMKNIGNLNNRKLEGKLWIIRIIGLFIKHLYRI